MFVVVNVGVMDVVVVDVVVVDMDLWHILPKLAPLGAIKH